MLSVKQGGIKYHFLSLWYDSTWDWTQVSRAISSIDETLSSSNNPGQSGHGGNGNEGIAYEPQIPRAGASPSDAIIWIEKSMSFLVLSTLGLKQ